MTLLSKPFTRTKSILTKNTLTENHRPYRWFFIKDRTTIGKRPPRYSPGPGSQNPPPGGPPCPRGEVVPEDGRRGSVPRRRRVSALEDGPGPPAAHVEEVRRRPPGPDGDVVVTAHAPLVGAAVGVHRPRPPPVPAGRRDGQGRERSVSPLTHPALPPGRPGG